MVIGGDSVGDRHIWWNFVSSSKERIEQAKTDWKDRRFDDVVGESEFISLPDKWVSGNPLHTSSGPLVGASLLANLLAPNSRASSLLQEHYGMCSGFLLTYLETQSSLDLGQRQLALSLRSKEHSAHPMFETL